MYFNIKNIKSLEDLKKEYRKLAKMWHPDITKTDTSKIMAEINNEYTKLFETFKNIKFNHEEKTYYQTKEETTETPEEFINVINRLIIFNDIDIMLCGSWLWITGNTYQHKELLKELKFKFSNKKKAWYLHYDEFIKKSKKSFTLDEIKNIFGFETFKNTYRFIENN